jgi:cell division septal protein FtsQ
LGRSDLGSRFDKFVDVALAIVERHAQAISYVDMRYMNGFAIGWRHAAPAV